MKITSQVLGISALTTVASVIAFGVVAIGQTVPGERWQQKITVQMAGMNMPMPGSDMCVPVGKAQEAVMKPDKDCVVSNVRNVGNKFTANVKCTGKDKMEGTIEQTVEANVITGKMTAKMDGETMTMLMESKKLGPCQAVDTAAVVAAGEARGRAAVASRPDPCVQLSAPLKTKPQDAGAMAAMFIQPGGQCTTTPANADFCAAIQTRPGFSGLTQADGSNKGVAARSLTACNLGTVDAVRTRLLTSAEAAGDGNFIATQAPARAREIAKTECVMKGEMWAGKAKKWDSFCDSDFAESARRGK